MITIYTSNPYLMPEGVGARAIGPVILVRKIYRYDRGIREHEKEHVFQWMVVAIIVLTVLCALCAAGIWNSWILNAGLFVTCTGHALLYVGVRRYRLWCEVWAYREQMRWPDRTGRYLTLELAAWRLSQPLYRLGLSLEQAKDLLQGKG